MEEAKASISVLSVVPSFGAQLLVDVDVRYSFFVIPHFATVQDESKYITWGGETLHFESDIQMLVIIYRRNHIGYPLASSNLLS